MNTDLQYAAVFAPAAGFQARRQLVVTDGGGWMDGWVSYDVLPPSVFFSFKHDNKQLELIRKICLKAA